MKISQLKGESNLAFLVASSEAVTEIYPEESAVSLQNYLFILLAFVAVYHILISFSQSTYYSPYTRTKELLFYPKGKFVNQYYHWREQGIKVGLFEKHNSNTSSVANNVEGNTSVKLLALPL